MQGFANVRKRVRDLRSKFANAQIISPKDLTGVLDVVEAALENAEQRDRALETQCERLFAHQLLLDRRLLGIERNRFVLAFNAVMTRLFDWRGRMMKLLNGASDPAQQLYQRWIQIEEAAQPSVAEQRATIETWAYRPVISIVATLDQPQLTSLDSQSYPYWELVNDQAPMLAEGEYLLFLRSGDRLAPAALYYIVEALQHTVSDVIYFDHDFIDQSGRRMRPVFKPDWSPHLLLSCMYVGPGWVVRRSLFEHTGGAQEYDLLLRITDRPAHIGHISRILYHQQTATPPAGPAHAQAALAAAVQRRWPDQAFVEPGQAAGTYVIRRKLDPGTSISIVICSRNLRLARRCINAIRATAGVAYEIILVHHIQAVDSEERSAFRQLPDRVIEYAGSFDFSLMNNLAARSSTASNLLFLNDDVIARNPIWLTLLSEALVEREAGIVGAMLRYPSGAIQHAGIAVGITDGAGHPGRFQRASDLWPWLPVMREVSAVTGACMAMRRNVFDELGGFDTGFPNNYNDVDICLRARAAGYQVLCLGDVGLIHEECRTRAGVTHLEERDRFYARWGHVLAKPDPFYSTSLAPTEIVALNFEGQRRGVFANMSRCNPPSAT
jgi:O-antigen biosynthesis protein